jgi:hypothetical protein
MDGAQGSLLCTPTNKITIFVFQNGEAQPPHQNNVYDFFNLIQIQVTFIL